MLPQPWLRKRAPRAFTSKSSIPMARIAENALMTSSRRITFVSKSSAIQVMARPERCMIPRRHLNKLRL